MTEQSHGNPLLAGNCFWRTGIRFKA